MYAGSDFSPSNTVETEPYAFDFANDLPPGDSIVSAAWSLSVASGIDPSPSSHLDGTPWIVSATITAQRISGLLSGVTYLVQCRVNTAQSNTLNLYSHIRSEVIS